MGTTTARSPVPQEFPRRIAIEQIPVHEYQYEQVEDYDYVHYPHEDEDARHVEPEYVDYPDYSPVPSSCPSSLAECVSSCAPVLPSSSAPTSSVSTSALRDALS